MKRAVERELTQPAAAKLAELTPDELTVVTVRAGDSGLSVSVQAPGWAAKVPVGDRAALPVAERIAAAWNALDRIDALLDSLRPKAGVVSGKVAAEHERYFALKELADAVSDTLNAYEDRLEDGRLARLEGRQPEAVGRRPRYRAIKVKRIGYDWHESQPLRSLASAESMEAALRELLRHRRAAAGRCGSVRRGEQARAAEPDGHRACR